MALVMVIESIYGKDENFSTSTGTSLHVLERYFQISHVLFLPLTPYVISRIYGGKVGKMLNKFFVVNIFAKGSNN